MKLPKISVLAAVVLFTMGGSTAILAQGGLPPPAPGAAHSMTRAMSPTVYTNMMMMMANPYQMMLNPMMMCAQCHGAEDMKRYDQTMGPMLRMMNPVNWINPNAYTAMMTPMMDPKAYTDWYNAWMQKYGGAAAPTTTTEQAKKK